MSSRPAKKGAVERHLLGLAGVVELLAQALGDLLADLGGVDRAEDAAARAT
jgi:hypothetical protein